MALTQVTTATFFGSVTDPSGAIMPGAKARLTHEETGTVTTKTASATGEFQFDFLGVGNYTLNIRADKFKSLETSGIEQILMVNTVALEQLESISEPQLQQLPLSSGMCRAFLSSAQLSTHLTGAV